MTNRIPWGPDSPGYDEDEVLEWARKVAASRPPRYTDASRNAARCIIAYCNHDAPDQARELLARGLDVLERFHDHEAANSNTEGALEIEALMADYAAYLKGAA